MKRLAIFASGTGSNAKKIVEYFYDHSAIEVACIISNKKSAGVLSLCDEYDELSKLVIDRSFFYDSEEILNVLKLEGIDYIVLAGFLWLIPSYLIEAYPDKIINIHPALLPKYGGKGMYGKYVHEAVKAAGDIVSGPTIHLVNNKYDEGRILNQVQVELDENDSAEEIARKVLQAEHQYFAPTIESYILDSKR